MWPIWCWTKTCGRGWWRWSNLFSNFWKHLILGRFKYVGINVGSSLQILVDYWELCGMWECNPLYIWIWYERSHPTSNDNFWKVKLFYPSIGGCLSWWISCWRGWNQHVWCRGIYGKIFMGIVYWGNTFISKVGYTSIYVCKSICFGGRPMKVNFQMLASLLNKILRFQGFKLRLTECST